MRGNLAAHFAHHLQFARKLSHPSLAIWPSVTVGPRITRANSQFVCSEGRDIYIKPVYSNPGDESPKPPAAIKLIPRARWTEPTSGNVVAMPLAIARIADDILFK